MKTALRFLALPLLLIAVPAFADVRDKAALFSPEAVKKADAELARIERETKCPVVIETIRSLEGTPLDAAVKERGKDERIRGLFVLIPVKEHKVDAGASHEFDKFLSRPIYQSISNAFADGFKHRDFDAGLAAGVANIGSTLRGIKFDNRAAAAQGTPGRQPANAPVRAGGGSGMSSLIWIIAGVIGVMILFRIIGAIMGAGRGAAGGPGYGGGRGPGYGPGYGGGGPGYGGGGGGGGGGFMSGLMGGIGGAFLGNALYDQFSGRHNAPQSGYVPPAADPGAGAAPDAGGDWGGTAGDGGADWGGGGADTGGGGGGGADWGGGGGDGGGGGGGDWGGGGGGGDWGGGGGGDGGSW